MKVLCPRCKRHVDLHYLEKKGDQMARCAKCNTVVAATYKEDRDRLYWEVFFEKPLRSQDKDPTVIGCWWMVVVGIIFFIAMMVALGNWSVSNEQPDESPAEQFHN